MPFRCISSLRDFSCSQSSQQFHNIPVWSRTSHFTWEFSAFLKCEKKKYHLTKHTIVQWKCTFVIFNPWRCKIINALECPQTSTQIMMQQWQLITDSNKVPEYCLVWIPKSIPFKGLLQHQNLLSSHEKFGRYKSKDQGERKSQVFAKLKRRNWSSLVLESFSPAWNQHPVQSQETRWGRSTVKSIGFAQSKIYVGVYNIEVCREMLDPTVPYSKVSEWLQ